MKTTRTEIRRKGSKFQAVELTKSIKGINPWYCSKIILDDCESEAEAAGALAYHNDEIEMPWSK